MPVGPFKDFPSCVRAQMKIHAGEKGFTIENARKICGAIEKRTGNKDRLAVHPVRKDKKKKRMDKHDPEEDRKRKEKMSDTIIIESNANWENV